MEINLVDSDHIGRENTVFFMRKSIIENEMPNIIKQAVEELRQGKQNYLFVIYQALASHDKETIDYAAVEIARYMRNLNADRIIRLDECFRQYTSIEWIISWENVNIDLWEKSIRQREAYLWVLRLGTFHPNGYFREKCIVRLAEDNESLKFVLLRLNDWVKPVRESAEKAAFKRILKLNAEELVTCLPYLAKVRRGVRRDWKMLQGLEKHIADRIQQQLHNVDLKNLGRYDIKARKYLYRILIEHNILRKAEADYVLDREKNGQCQFLLVTLIFNHFELSMEELNTYLNHKNKVVQRKAMEQKYHILGTYWDGLEEMLLSTSIGVREQAGYILRKHTGIDIVAYYAKRLETPRKKICILGIGECGRAEDAELLLCYLDDADAGIVKNTLHAVSKLLKTKADEIFWKYLQDERPVVQRAAYREIVANRSIYGAKRVYELFIGTESSLLKEKLAYQLLRESSWDRLSYVLRLYCYKEESIREIIRRGVYGRNIYGHISKRDAEEIREILYDKKYGIPETIQKNIEFDLRFVVR